MFGLWRGSSIEGFLFMFEKSTLNHPKKGVRKRYSFDIHKCEVKLLQVNENKLNSWATENVLTPFIFTKFQWGSCLLGK